MAYRAQHMQRVEQQKRDAAREASSARAITYAEYCQLKAADAISRQAEAKTA